MNLIVEQLQNDHRQLVRVLYHLDREIKALHGLGGCKANLAAILDQLDYIQVYPELWHHPTEDVIAGLLLQKNIPEAEWLASCMEEHQVLELLTENLHSYLDQFAAGNSHVRSRLIKAGTDYVKRQLTHMEHEQHCLFPLMERYLQAEDWAQIKAHIKSMRPSAEDERVQHYQLLYRDIARLSPVTAH